MGLTQEMSQGRAGGRARGLGLPLPLGRPDSSLPGFYHWLSFGSAVQFKHSGAIQTWVGLRGGREFEGGKTSKKNQRFHNFTKLSQTLFFVPTPLHCPGHQICINLGKLLLSLSRSTR